MRSKSDHNKKHADVIDGVATAKNQHGLTASGKPRKAKPKTD